MNNLAKWSLLIGMGSVASARLGWYAMTVFLGLYTLVALMNLTAKMSD